VCVCVCVWTLIATCALLSPMICLILLSLCCLHFTSTVANCVWRFSSYVVVFLLLYSLKKTNIIIITFFEFSFNIFDCFLFIVSRWLILSRQKNLIVIRRSFTLIDSTCLSSCCLVPSDPSDYCKRPRLHLTNYYCSLFFVFLC